MGPLQELNRLLTTELLSTSSTAISNIDAKLLFTGCDGYSWLQTWLYLGLTKTQVVEYGCTCEGFFLIIWSEKTHTFNPDFLRWEDPPLM